MYAMRGSEDENLDALFRAFREACPTPDPSSNFMPVLWQRIEARQNLTFSLRRMTGAFVTAALALSLALGIYLALPQNSTYFSQSYVEALAAARTSDSADFYEPANFELQ
jgi:hypothetical protein